MNMSDKLTTMKTWQLHAFGLENLTLDTVNVPFQSLMKY
jgi:hypothetical protein